MKKNHISAFSLVEMAITISIVALLVAAVISGSHLLHGAKLNKIITDFTKYAQSVETFEQKYKNLPGDMPDATSNWTGTANGNGDYKISGDLTESLRAWQQLRLSGIIEGNYSGTDAGSPDFQRNVNVPEGVFKESFFFITHFANYYGTSGNVIEFVAIEDDTTTDPTGGIISPQDAYAIDQKADDGDADNGYLYTIRGDDFNTNGNCATNPYSSATADFVYTQETATCRMAYWYNKE